MPDKWAKWERTRAKGEKWVVWRLGVFGFGLAMATLWSIKYAVSETPYPPWWVGLPLNFTLWPVGGYIWGKIFWRTMENRYLAERKQSD
jgi:hypothetical protein